MPKKLLKIFIYLLALILSPLIIAGIAGAIFIAIQMANGASFSAGALALFAFIKELVPSLPYITGVPAVMVVVAYFMRKKHSPEKQ